MKLKCIVMVFLLLWSIPEAGAWNLEISSPVGSGARATGMGGAFIAVADDASAISWNPAGLTRLDEPEAGLAVTFGSGSWDFEIPSELSDGGLLSIDNELESELTLNFMSAVMPFKLGERHAVAAVGIRRYWDQNQKQTTTYRYEDPDFFGDVLEDVYESDNSGAVNAVSPAFALQLSPMLSLGATINIMTGNREYKYEETSGYYLETYTLEQSNSYSGFNAEFGALADVSPKIRAGAVVSIPWTLKVTDVEEQSGENPAVELDDSEVGFPIGLGGGLAVKPSPPLTLAFDLHYNPWSKIKIDDQEQELEDAVVVRAGAEYLLIGENSVIPLRAGFYMEPLPRTDDSGDQMKETAFTVGAGLILGKVTLDLSYVRSSQSFQEEWEGELIEHKLAQNLFTISGVIHFSRSEEY